MRPRIPAIDGLRTLAMLAVFFTHYTAITATWLPQSWLGQQARHLVRVTGGMGSNTFFVLAGLFAARALLGNTTRPLDFLQNRLWRLYPAYLLVLCAYVAAAMLSPAWSKLPADPAWSIMMNALLVPLAWGATPILVVSWTLGVIAVMYVATALLAMSRRTLAIRPWLVPAVLFVISAVAPTELLQTGGVLFSCGVTLYLLARHGSYSHLLCIGVTTAGIACRVLHASGVHPGEFLPAVVSPVYRLAVEAAIPSGVVLALVSRPNVHWGILSNPVLIWLASLSYSFYLVHGAVLRVLKATVFPLLAAMVPAVFPLVSFGAGLAAAVGAALALHRLVERPCHTYARRFSASQQASQPLPESRASAATV